MNFSEALTAIKAGRRLARSTWNTFARPGWNEDAQIFVYLVQGSKFTVNRAPLNAMFAEGTEITYRPHIDCKARDGSCGTWTPNDSDLMAEDWEIIE